MAQSRNDIAFFGRLCATAAQEKKIEYKVDLSWDGKSGGAITLPKGSTLRIDISKEFGGEGFRTVRMDRINAYDDM